MERLVRRGPLSSWRLIPTRPPLRAAIEARSLESWSRAEGASTVVTGCSERAAAGATADGCRGRVAGTGFAPPLAQAALLTGIRRATASGELRPSTKPPPLLV